MGMPAFFYRVFYRSHSVKSLQRNILAFCGVDPVRVTLIGMIEAAKAEARGVWLARMSALGREAR
jgi:putative NADPH-quinone reductase